MDGRDEPPTPSPGHLSLDELADLDAGLLTPADDAAARAHVADCTVCTADLTALGELGAVLAAATVSIPADVAARIDAALANEARERASVAGSTTSARESSPGASQSAAGSVPVAPAAHGSSPAIDLDAVRARRERSSRIRRGAATLVGVAAVLGGGYLFGDTLLSAVDLSTSGDDSADSAAEGAATDTGGAAEAPAAPESGAEDGGESGTSSGTAYTAATLSSDATLLLEQQDVPVAPVPTSMRELDADGAEDTSRCVDAVAQRAGSSGSPLAVDVGTFDGVPAVVIVLPDPRGSDDVAQVWVVSDTCLQVEPSSLDVLDRVTLSDLPAAE